jgi:hypothetical protein
MGKEHALRAISLASALALALAGCASRERPRDEGRGGGRTPPAESSFLRIEGIVAGVDGQVISVAGVAGKSAIIVDRTTLIKRRMPASFSDISSGLWLKASDATRSASTPARASSISLSENPKLLAEVQPAHADRQAPRNEGGPSSGPGGSSMGPPPDSMKGPGGGTRPEGGSGPRDADRDRAIIGKVASVDGRTVVLSGQDSDNAQSMKIIVEADAEIARIIEAKVDDIQAKVRVLIVAERSRDGKLRARSVELD